MSKVTQLDLFDRIETARADVAVLLGTLRGLTPADLSLLRNEYDDLVSSILVAKQVLTLAMDAKLEVLAREVREQDQADLAALEKETYGYED